MTANSEEKLKEIQEYVEGIAPVVRTVRVVPPQQQAFNCGWAQALHAVQQDLLDILDD
jgi:hypothetical protein